MDNRWQRVCFWRKWLKVVYLLWQISTEEKPAWQRDRACFAATEQRIASCPKTEHTVCVADGVSSFILMPFWDWRRQSWMIISTERPEQGEAGILQQNPDLWAPPGKLKPKPRCSIKESRWGSHEQPRLLPTTTLALRTTLVREVGGCQSTSKPYR